MIFLSSLITEEIAPRPLSDDYWLICPLLSKIKPKDVVQDCHNLELVQATFYVMVVNGALELGVLANIIACIIKDVLLDLYWCPF